MSSNHTAESLEGALFESKKTLFKRAVNSRYLGRILTGFNVIGGIFWG